MVYMIEADRFRAILDMYPDYRSFVVIRSVMRRSYFKKTFEENKQVVLFKMKKQAHLAVVSAMGIENLYDQRSDDEDDDNDIDDATK